MKEKAFWRKQVIYTATCPYTSHLVILSRRPRRGETIGAVGFNGMIDAQSGDEFENEDTILVREKKKRVR